MQRLIRNASLERALVFSIPLFIVIAAELFLQFRTWNLFILFFLILCIIYPFIQFVKAINWLTSPEKHPIYGQLKKYGLSISELEKELENPLCKIRDIIFLNDYIIYDYRSIIVIQDYKSIIWIHETVTTYYESMIKDRSIKEIYIYFLNGHRINIPTAMQKSNVKKYRDLLEKKTKNFLHGDLLIEKTNALIGYHDKFRSLFESDPSLLRTHREELQQTINSSI